MTSEEFFQQIRTPIHWKLVGKNDVPDSIGFVFDDRTTRTIYRLFFNINSEKGGIVARTGVGMQQKKKCLAHNKTADELNYFINNI